MNAPKSAIDKIISIIPALRQPTISSLSEEQWVALEVIVSEKMVRKLIPELKKAGAEGIFEYNINKLID